MKPGALGFYRPEPSGTKSPYIIREIIGDKLQVLVIPTQMEFTIERAEWMSIEEMENSHDHLKHCMQSLPYPSDEPVG